MTREEIVKALRCYASVENCPVKECNEKCPYWLEDDKFDLYGPNAEISDRYQLCRAAADMLEQDAKKTSWISVKDRLPDEDLAYMVFYHEWSNGEFLPKYDERYVKILKFFRGLGWRFPVCVDKRCENDTNREVTHWMPLPEPPKENGGIK